MSKAISARPDIIHHNQPGYVIRNCSIGKTVCSIFDKTDFTIKENIPGSLIYIVGFTRPCGPTLVPSPFTDDTTYINYQKEFKVWNVVDNCLKAFNFGSDFI